MTKKRSQIAFACDPTLKRRIKRLADTLPGCQGELSRVVRLIVTEYLDKKKVRV
tara:strand:- start:4977 stop:5138 length:162 start_codon:yes stop_codon:yes gene_type:complete